MMVHPGERRIKAFQVAYDIIGGGEEGDKRNIHSKEAADHSLPYMVAVALLDGQVQPEQYAWQRIIRADVQALLKKVSVAPDAGFSARFPREMPSAVEVELHDGTVLSASATAYKGFTSQPLDWAEACEKFTRLATPFTGHSLGGQIARSVHELDTHSVRKLTALLAKVPLARRIRAAA